MSDSSESREAWFCVRYSWAIIKHPTLSGNARLAALAAAPHTNNETGEFYVSNETWSREAGLSVSTLKKVRGELEGADLLETLETGGGILANTYRAILPSLEGAPHTGGRHTRPGRHTTPNYLPSTTHLEEETLVEEEKNSDSLLARDVEDETGEKPEATSAVPPEIREAARKAGIADEQIPELIRQALSFKGEANVIEDEQDVESVIKFIPHWQGKAAA